MPIKRLEAVRLDDITLWIIGGFGVVAAWAMLTVLGAERERRVAILRAELEEQMIAEQQKHLMRKRH